MKTLLISILVITMFVEAAPELRLMTDYSAREYEVVESNLKLVTTINETITTANWWHPLENGSGAYSFLDLAKVLQGTHLHLSEDTPLVLNGTRESVEPIKIREVIVGLYRSRDGKMMANRFFVVTTDGAVVVLQKYSGTKLVNELSSQITALVEQGGI